MNYQEQYAKIRKKVYEKTTLANIAVTKQEMEGLCDEIFVELFGEYGQKILPEIKKKYASMEINGKYNWREDKTNAWPGKEGPDGGFWYKGMFGQLKYMTPEECFRNKYL